MIKKTSYKCRYCQKEISEFDAFAGAIFCSEKCRRAAGFCEFIEQFILSTGLEEKSERSQG